MNDNNKPLPHGIKTILNVIIIVILIIVVLATIFLIMLMGIPASNGTTTSIVNVFLAIGLGIILPLFIANTLLRKINAGPNPEPTKFFAESAKNTLIKIMATSIAILMFVVIITYIYLAFITK